MMDSKAPIGGLPPHVETILSGFLKEASEVLGPDLTSAVLFGSAAEAKLSPTSDVNLLLVLGRFDPAKLGGLSAGLLAAEAAIQLRVMFLLESELPQAAEFFAQKFADILRRHRVLHGKDVLADLAIPRKAEIFRLRQILLNLTLRLRESYVARGGQPEQVARVLADAVGPLRAAAATLFELEGTPTGTSDEALTAVAQAHGPSAGGAVADLLAVHDGKRVEADVRETLLHVIELATYLSERSARLG